MPKLKHKDKISVPAKSSRSSVLKKASIVSSSTAKKATRDFVLIKDPDELENANTKFGAGLSRGQRRRQLKKQKVLIKLGKADPILKHKNAYVDQTGFSHLLSDLESSLPATDGPADRSITIIAAAAVAGKTNKMKKQIAMRESQRMKLVQQHPSFIENPVAAINNHLQHLIAMRTAENTRSLSNSKNKITTHKI